MSTTEHDVPVSVRLKGELGRFVRDILADGKISEQELIETALEKMMQEDKRGAEHEAELTAATLEGLRAVDEGRTMSTEELQARIQARKQERLSAWKK